MKITLSRRSEEENKRDRLTDALHQGLPNHLAVWFALLICLPYDFKNKSRMGLPVDSS